MTSTIPKLHSDFLDTVTHEFSQDPRISALLAGGSMVHGGFDEHSDLDLVVVVGDEAYEQVMAQRRAIAEGLGELLAAFTGEHVGEPRLLICLFGPQLLHVDLKFIVRSDLVRLVERPFVLWAREREEVAEALDAAIVEWPNRPPDWFEDRAWIWLHYGAAKLQRGELFEAMAMVAFFRDQVLGPMLQRNRGLPQRGVRKLEQLGLSDFLLPTVADHTSRSVSQALRNAADLYVELRSAHPPERVVRGMPSTLNPWFEVPSKT